jgi:hypothetical protein
MYIHNTIIFLIAKIKNKHVYVIKRQIQGELKKSEDEKRIENEDGAEEEYEETGRLHEATGIRIWDLMRTSE